MAWRIEYSPSAEKTLAKLDRQVARAILNFMDLKIATLTDPRATGHSLVGNLGGLWRYRMGDHRIICDIQDTRVVIEVIKIGHRSKVYG